MSASEEVERLLERLKELEEAKRVIIKRLKELSKELEISIPLEGLE